MVAVALRQTPGEPVLAKPLKHIGCKGALKKIAPDGKLLCKKCLAVGYPLVPK